MPSVTKTYASRVRNVSVTADGKNVNVLVDWEEQGAADPRRGPASRTALSIAGGKVSCLGKELGAAPAEVGKLAAELASKIPAIVEGLVTSGKIKP
jgi:hypothetical protein